MASPGIYLLNKGIDADAAISSFDSYTALKSVSGLVPAWHSPLNVNELYILIKK
jgi:glycerate-2-kinase